MDGTSLSFYVASALALAGALLAVAARRPERALAGLALVGAALVVPLVLVSAELVALVELLAALTSSALLLGLHALPRADAASHVRARAPLAVWLLGGVALLVVVWVLLATGSRQVVEAAAKPLLFGRYALASLAVGLIALVAVIASAFVRERRAEP
jgi:NADH:ubiquinone oxidoreductase subunit 6 (subunit J)